MQPIIKVQDISKRYQLGLTHAGSIRELVNGAVGKVFGRGVSSGPHPVAGASNGEDHIWALRDVSFEVNPGEAIGIIGRNGAGKSTLLKVLSRITRPTHGRIELHGRVASLLEVGTGFHPELTGRENVYMNGTILGMTKKEIRREFDSIVEFAEVEKFIDTPVKRYSSGMTVRLGFAVAAHLNPEILIVDEVLAVGDVEFQKRCLGKMDDIAKSGRTVLFVSHNMASIRQLTSKAVLIEDGRMAFHGETERAVEQYLGYSRDRSSDPNAIAVMKRPSWAGNESVRFVYAEVEQSYLTARESINFDLAIESSRATEFHIGATLYSSDGAPIAAGFTEKLSSTASTVPQFMKFRIDNPGLAPGHYWFTLGVLKGTKELLDVVEEVLHFEVSDTAIVFPGFKQWSRNFGSIQLPIVTVS